MDELLAWGQPFGLSLTPGQIEQFRIYESLLLEWNERISLTAIRDPREIRIRHFLDSLTCATVTGALGGRSLIDIGSGAGFPGLPLKILFPGLKLTLVDSVAKKARFSLPWNWACVMSSWSPNEPRFWGEILHFASSSIGRSPGLWPSCAFWLNTCCRSAGLEAQCWRKKGRAPRPKQERPRRLSSGWEAAKLGSPSFSCPIPISPII